MHEVRRLPGPSAPAGDPRTGPPDGGTLAEALLDGLLADSIPPPPSPLDAVARSLEAHREHRRAWYGDLVGPLGVPAAAAAELVDALGSGDHAMRMVLIGPWASEVTAYGAAVQVTPADLDELMRAARALLLDDDRIELGAVELELLDAGTPGEAAEQTLAELDVASPSWLRVPADESWIGALDVIAQDGAENVALVLPEPAQDGDRGHQQLAVMLVALTSRGLRFCIADPPGGAGLDLVTTGTAYGLLNLLCAVNAALNGEGQALLGQLLGETRPELVTSAARAIGDGEAAAVRRLLDRVSCASVRALVGDLEAAGLIVPDVA